jgi:hypothetical protein
MSNFKAQSSNKTQMLKDKIDQKEEILTLNHFDIHLAFEL